MSYPWADILIGYQVVIADCYGIDPASPVGRYIDLIAVRVGDRCREAGLVVGIGNLHCRTAKERLIDISHLAAIIVVKYRFADSNVVDLLYRGKYPAQAVIGKRLLGIVDYAVAVDRFQQQVIRAVIGIDSSYIL